MHTWTYSASEFLDGFPKSSEKNTADFVGTYFMKFTRKKMVQELYLFEEEEEEEDTPKGLHVFFSSQHGFWNRRSLSLCKVWIREIIDW